MPRPLGRRAPQSLPAFADPLTRQAHDGSTTAGSINWVGWFLYPPVLAGRAGTTLAPPLRMNDLPHQSLLEELDARQDELLAELDRLNQRLEQVIRESTSLRGPAADQPLPKAA